MKTIIRRQFATEVRVLNEREQTMRFIASDETRDRYGDIIRASGWKLTNYKRNPVVLFGHDYGAPAVGKAVRVAVEDNKLVIDVKFAPTTMGQELWLLYSQGYMSAVSVGFLPVPGQWKDLKDEDGNWLGYEFLEQELLELSLVPVPANPSALSQADEKGIVCPQVRSFIAARGAGEVGGPWLPSMDDAAEQPTDVAPQTLADVLAAARQILGEDATIAPDDQVLAREVVSLLSESLGDDVTPTTKAGAVLSKKNKGLLAQARDLIDEVLAAAGDDTDEGEKALTPEIHEVSETPALVAGDGTASAPAATTADDTIDLCLVAQLVGESLRASLSREE